MEKVIHIFDMDDTVLVTPTFGSMVGAKNGEVVDINSFYSEYFISVKAAFWDVLSKEVTFVRMIDFIVPINTTNNKYFSSDLISYFTDKKYKRMFEDHKGVLVLKPIPDFHSNPLTIGKEVNEPVFQKYKEVENKMILTGRKEALAADIMQRFSELGIESPNYGLKTYNPGRLSIEQFKIATIMQSIAEFGWTVVHFYEDRKDWLLNAMTAVTTQFPSVTFYPHLITDVKDKLKIQ